MKLKLLKDIRMQGAPTVQILAGSMVDASDETAKAWMSAGVAVPMNIVETATPKMVTEKAVTGASVTDREREQTRERVRRYREKKALQVKDGNNGSG